MLIEREIERLAQAAAAGGCWVSLDGKTVDTAGAAYLLERSHGTIQNWCYGNGPVVGHRTRARGPRRWYLREIAEFRLFLSE